MTSSSSECDQPSRFVSLDGFRGITIALMIVINQASVAPEVYPWLAHADWHGCTIADLVFPWFLWIMGMAMAFSFDKYQVHSPPLNSPIHRKILRRTLILFGLGLLLNGYWSYDLATIRIWGVLQRIAICYLLSSLLILHAPKKVQWGATIAILVSYALALGFIPVAGYGAGDLSRIGNVGAYIDRWIIPQSHLYAWDSFDSMGDPEGLLGSIAAVSTTMAGYFVGGWLKRQTIHNQVALQLTMAGLASLIIGKLWSIWIPLNKKLWTSSFVFWSVGWGLLIFALVYYLIEIKKIHRPAKPLIILGLNPIAVFVASVLVLKTMVKVQIPSSNADNVALSLYQYLYDNCFGNWLPGAMGSLAFGLITLVSWVLVAWILEKQKIIIKL